MEGPRVRTNCPRCGQVEFEAGYIYLDFDRQTNEGDYSFVCPVCEELVVKPVDHKIAKLLMAIGVEIGEINIPAELHEDRPEGPVITLDDVVDLHFDLRDEAKVALALDEARYLILGP